MNTEQFIQAYQTIFETKEKPLLFFSPGRINLIGEHIDYNGGYVFPCAMTFGTYGAVSTRDDKHIKLFSKNFEEVGILSFSLDDLTSSENDSYSAYIKGVMAQFIKAGYPINQGFNLYIEGTIPNGAGLSSSASLEVLTSIILVHLNQLNMSMIECVKLSQQAEHEVGVACGIMDQFAIGMGKANYAIKLNTGNLSYAYADANLEDYQVLIMNTNKRRELTNSKYNERRRECEEALALLQRRIAIKHLCDLDVKTYEEISNILHDEVLYKRARHAVTENERVEKAIAALAKQDLLMFGKLLNESHDSLRDNYEVTGLELDTIVSLARQQRGVLGARMIGAGFGGCAIALVHQDLVEQVKGAVREAYTKMIGHQPSFYVAAVGDGARIIS